MADNRNFAALDWLIHEISETLKEARQSLESYVENPKDAARIRFCLTHIHQVHGSLQMVEFYGAAMLASEMEQLTQAMIAGTVANASEAQEVLMRAILQFPLYLDQVKATRKDNPLIVLPLLNDLRAVRGESLLTDTKLFVPNLTPAKKVSGGRLPVTHDNVQFQAMVLKLRQMYQYAASGFIRGVNPDENLAYLQKAFSRLQKLTHGTARYALWDICLALVEAIEIDAIEISVAVKNLLRQLDKEIKVLAVHGVKALNSFTNDELIKNLLYYVARAGKHAPGFSPNSHLQRIYETYHLEEALLEGKESGDETQHMLSVPDAEAMRSVVGALKEELNLIKNSLDVCLAGGDTQTTLSDAMPIVKRVADTMAVLGLGDLRKRVLEQGAALELVADAQGTLGDDQLLAIASEIISVENALDSLLEAGGQDSHAVDEADITLTRAKESVLREARNGLEHAKDAIIEYIASQWNRQHLQSVPTTLREIRGGLEIMPLPRPARILGACARFIEEQLLEQEANPQWSTLDTLADAITSVEYYLERLSSGGRKEENDLLLGVAEESVASLGYSVAKTGKLETPASLSVPRTPAIEAPVESHPEEAALAAAYGKTLYPQAELPATEEFPAEDESSSQLEAIYAQAIPEAANPADAGADEWVTEETEPAPEAVFVTNDKPGEVLEAEDIETGEIEAQPVATAEGNLVATNNAPVIKREENEDIDDEIIEIFIEEATEVTETIGEYFPRWAQDFEDNDSLIEFRRAFHTLKGSGRMVGANDIGELAWSIENMLNRVIDHTIVAQAVHVQIIEKVRGLLPDMIAAFRDNRPNPHADLAETYRQQAHSLSQGVIPDALLAGQETGSTGQATPSSIQSVEPGADGLGDDTDSGADEVALFAPEEPATESITATEVADDEAIIPLADTSPGSDGLAIEPADDTSGDEAALTRLYSEQQPASFNYAESIAEEDIDIDDPDAQLWDIFGAEAIYHLHVVQQFIQRMETEAPIYEPPSEDMQRALHTLKGSAHMAEVTQVAELVTPLERFVKELRSYHVNINDDILQLLRDAVSYTQVALRQIEAGEAVGIPRLQQFIARVHELRDIHVAPLVSLQEADAMGKRPVDPELLAIFMAEEMNLLLDADKIITQWQANPADTDHLIPVMAELGKLTQAAAHAYLPPMAELGSKIHHLYEAIMAGQLSCSPRVCDSLNLAHTALLDMVDAIAAGQNLGTIPEAVNDALDDLLTNEVVTVTNLATDQAPVVTEDIPLIEAVIEEQPEGAANTGFDADALPTLTLEETYLLEPDESGALEAAEAIELTGLDIPESTGDETVEIGESFTHAYESPEFDEQLLMDEIVAFDAANTPTDEAEIAITGLDLAETFEPANVEPAGKSSAEEETLPEFAGLDEAIELEALETPAVESSLDELDLGETIELADTLAPDETIELDEPALFGEMVELIDEDANVLEQQVPELIIEAEPDNPVLLDEEPAVDEDFDPEIVEIFIEEAGELLEEIDGALNEWQDDWSNTDCVEQLKRSLHTFKGGARLAGLMDLGDLSHDFETILIEMDEDAELDQAFFARLHSYQDRMHAGVERSRARLNGETLPGAATPGIETSASSATEYLEPPVLDTYVSDDEVADEITLAETGEQPVPASDEIDDGETVPATSFKPRVVVDNTRDLATALTPEGAPAEKPNVLTFAPKAKPAAPADAGGLRAGQGGPVPQVQHLAARRSGPQEVVKVSAELLEELVNLAGETSISRGRMEQQVSDLGNAIEEMDSTIQRLQEQLRRLDIETEAQVLFRQEQMMQHEEFDPLEMDRYSQLQQLSRSLIESASDLMDLKYTLADKTRDTETLLLQQSRINTDLQEGLMRSRMVPFSRLVPRLRRIVRQAATELGKEVDFELDNVEGELDRTVLERMVAPLEHMLRNAVDHGIESPEERIAAGKNPNGRILLTLGREGGDVIIRLQDDGRGINLNRVREKAIERGLMAADAQLADQDIIQFILHAGFSTAEKVTQISGRGVGMDVVHSEIKQLGGAMFIESNWGHGAEFTIRLPFTVSVNRALMVQIGDDLYAIPLNTIEGIVRVSPFELEHYYQDENARFDYAGEQYLVRYLGGLMDSNTQPKLDGQLLPLPVVLVRSTEHTVALQVDRLLGSREIVVKTLGAQFSAVRGVSGATVMGDGSVVVILDLHAMIREQLALGAQHVIQLEPLKALPVAEEDQSEKTIMVVDDSVTVRKVTGRFLEREGFRVITAKDGVEALQLLQDHIPDVMLLDIEMPRMDGFEVAKNVRTSSRLKDLPIIMITSRTGEKHRERAFSLGVNKYMGKPYQEDLLLTNIHELLKK